MERLYKISGFALHTLACIYIIGITVALPLYQKGSYGRIGSDKQAFFIHFNSIYWKILLPFLFLHLLLYLRSTYPSIKMHRHPFFCIPSTLSTTDLFVLGYLAAVLLSYFFSHYQDTAYLGSDNWSMGTFTQITLVLGYFFLSRFLRPNPNIACLMLPVSALLFLLGYLNRFDIWPISMEYHENAQFISFAGNINWYCGYIVTLLFFGVSLYWDLPFKHRKKQYLLGAYLFLGFGALVTNGSSSAILTLFCILLVLMSGSTTDQQHMFRFLEILLILGAACLCTLCIRSIYPDAITLRETSTDLLTASVLPIIFTLSVLLGYLALTAFCRKNTYPADILGKLGKGLLLIVILSSFVSLILLICNTLVPGSIGRLSDLPVFTFSPAWGSLRGATWTTGILLWWELPLLQKLFGVGPDCMSEYLKSGASEGLKTFVTSIWPSHQLSNTHCEWLTILINLGLTGLFCWAGLIISTIRSFLGKGGNGALKSNVLVRACGLSVLAYTIHNFVSFQQILNEPVMFVILGIGAAFKRRNDSFL